MDFKIPQTCREREQVALFVLETLRQNNLQNRWLIRQLAKEGFRIRESEMCEALALRRRQAKTDEFLARAERICKKYEKSCFGRGQSGS